MPPAKRDRSFMQTIRAVLWSFFGVRRGSDHASDMEKLNPVHIIFAALLAAALFVGTLLLIVQWVVA
jgi:amino acid transporter